MPTSSANIAAKLVTRLDARLSGPAQRFFGSPIPWVVAVALMMSVSIGRAMLIELPEPLPVLGTLPQFELTDQHGRRYGTNDLRGKAWVANFIFTRCPTVCPAFTAKMASIQHRARALGNAFHLVSFSVDPEHDTPQRLAEFAKGYRVNPRAWSFVTGPIDDVKKIVIEGLKVAMGNEDPQGNFEGIFHGSHFVLIDPLGQIRGYYDSSDVAAVDNVLNDVGWLLRRGS